MSHPAFPLPLSPPRLLIWTPVCLLSPLHQTLQGFVLFSFLSFSFLFSLSLSLSLTLSLTHSLSISFSLSLSLSLYVALLILPRKTRWAFLQSFRDMPMAVKLIFFNKKFCLSKLKVCYFWLFPQIYTLSF